MRLVPLPDLDRIRPASLAREREEKQDREARKPGPFAEVHRDKLRTTVRLQCISRMRMQRSPGEDNLAWAAAAQCLRGIRSGMIYLEKVHGPYTRRAGDLKRAVGCRKCEAPSPRLSPAFLD